MHGQTFTYPTYLLKLLKFVAGLCFTGLLFFIFSAFSDPPKAPREWIMLSGLLIFFSAACFFLTGYAALMNCHRLRPGGGPVWVPSHRCLAPNTASSRPTAKSSSGWRLMPCRYRGADL